MSNRAIASAERIREQVPVVRVLAALGYDVRTDADDREQQFSCDLHGSGHDDKPSARVYPDSNSWYCFGCSVTRDPIETVRAKQDVNFWQAVRILEQSFGLEPLPVDYGNDERGEDALHAVTEVLDHRTTYDDEEKRTKTLLEGFTKGKDLTLDKLLNFWGAFDKVAYHVRGPRGDGGVWSEVKGRKMMSGLRLRVLEAVKE